LQADLKIICAKIRFANCNLPNWKRMNPIKLSNNTASAFSVASIVLSLINLKDMWLSEDISYFCENCKDNAMFHFDDFSNTFVFP